LWNIVSMPTNHKWFLSSRWRFDMSLAKFSHNYTEMSSGVSSEEQECSSRVVGDICRILCSTINRSVCTLYWNKNISTFWVNCAFYYKIKSCAIVGTPCITFFSCLFLYWVTYMCTAFSMCQSLYDNLHIRCCMFLMNKHIMLYCYGVRTFHIYIIWLHFSK
jgi:hypothetical protein